jgi:hypothetical protein
VVQRLRDDVQHQKPQLHEVVPRKFILSGLMKTLEAYEFRVGVVDGDIGAVKVRIGWCSNPSPAQDLRTSSRACSGFWLDPYRRFQITQQQSAL